MEFKEARKVLNKYRNKYYNSTDKEEVELAKAIDTVFMYYVDFNERLEEVDEMYEALGSFTEIYVWSEDEDLVFVARKLKVALGELDRLRGLEKEITKIMLLPMLYQEVESWADKKKVKLW